MIITIIISIRIGIGFGISIDIRMLENLEKVTSEVSFSLPGLSKERVAPGLLVQIFSKHNSAVD